MTETDFPSKFEIHYYLPDESHSMDAFVKNRCEAEFLAVAAEVSDLLGVQITWEAFPLEEGGIREFWAAIGTNNAQIAIVLSTLALIWSVIPQSDQEFEALRKEETRLSIEEKKLEIEKLKRELQKGMPSEEASISAATISNDSHKIVTRRSNFYKFLSDYKKIHSVGFTELSIESKDFSLERVVTREKFEKFIVNSNDLEPLKIDAARIEIIAPVVKEGKVKWKGIYEGEYISFSMEDREFKSGVLSKQISFKNGSEIICVLQILRKIDELGNVMIQGYSVDLVLENIDSGSSKETPQGRRHRQTQKLVDGQDDLFEKL